MVSPVDMEGAAALAPAARLRLVPNVVDVAAIEPVPPRDGEPVVLFVADHTYEPNREAMRFLVEEAMPSLWEQTPDVRLVVAGKESDRAEAPRPANRDPRLRPRPRGPLRGGRMRRGAAVEGRRLAAEVRRGAGVSACRSPRRRSPPPASTSAAGEHYAEGAGDGPAFAAALREALDPERGNRLALAGRALAEAEYSIEALERRLAP